MSGHSIPAEERFWAKVDKGDGSGCWLWTGCRTKPDKCNPFRLAYGLFLFQGRLAAAHRVAWILTFGPIPEGLQVLHTCDNPSCVSPAHLWLGTHADNMIDRNRKGRQRFGVTNRAKGSRHWGAKLTEEQILEIRSRYEATKKHGVMTALAVEYGVSLAHVSRIVKNQTWTHI